MRFGDQATQDIFVGIASKEARRALPPELHEKAGRLLDRLRAAGTPMDLQTPRGNRLEKLTGGRAGQYSIRINDQYRICFRWEKDEAVGVTITDYH